MVQRYVTSKKLLPHHLCHVNTILGPVGVGAQDEIYVRLKSEGRKTPRRIILSSAENWLYYDRRTTIASLTRERIREHSRLTLPGLLRTVTMSIQAILTVNRLAGISKRIPDR